MKWEALGLATILPATGVDREWLLPIGCYMNRSTGWKASHCLQVTSLEG